MKIVKKFPIQNSYRIPLHCRKSMCCVKKPIYIYIYIPTLCMSAYASNLCTQAHISVGIAYVRRPIYV